MATVEIKNAVKNETISAIQQSLGTPQEKHFTKKEPLLKCTVGSVVSTLSLAQYYDEKSQSYQDPVPTYSFYFQELVKDGSGKVSKNTVLIPIPKDQDSLRTLGEHLIKVSEAIKGIEFKSSSSDADDLDAALDRLKAFRTKGV